MHRSALRLVALLTLVASATGETCYFPDGSVDQGGIECPRIGDNAVVACCRKSNHYCLDNGLCLEPNAWTMYRNSCTDKNFRAAGCPKICRHTAPRGYTGVNYCYQDAIWTCRGRNDCDKANFTMPSPRGRMLINTALESDLGIAAATSTGPSGTSIAVCSTTSEASSGISTGAAAGIGVGVGVPLAIAVVALTILLLREKKKSRAAGLNDGATTVGGSQPSPAPVWAKHEYPGGFVQAPQPGYGQQPTTELPPDPTVRHELPQ
ncbi:hypothetical protein CGCS363_v014952 [Colletotrichum siamense]|uniref:uncharacterized protein n=1 Tax=Colletotrichum siamense TaxID=690259 RepID=UPI001872F1B6|nr:uncharacterized protein CGCS363_v014952 [Colletotrichum siamense]KAF5484965.1 hypothetical protein CGCS363_v014952 [Colletotrichum siamense]